MNRLLISVAAAIAAALLLWPAPGAEAAAPPWTPQTPKLLALDYPAPAMAVLDAFRGIAYRNDGAVDVQGRFTLFAEPGVFFDSPGLNCSGFTLAGYRLLMGQDISLAQAKTDRLGDSGSGAALGEDWDFGWDFILNITEGRSPRVLTPEGQRPLTLEEQDGRSLRGFVLTDAAAWSAAMTHLKSGEVVLLSMSKPWSRNGYTLLHHHVAIILPTADGGHWYYHAVGKGGVTRVPLHEPGALASLLAKYPENTPGERRVLMLVVDLPR